MDKYYISNNITFPDELLDELWAFFIGFIESHGNSIIINHEKIDDNFDIDNDVHTYSDFPNEKPKKVYLTLKPFIVRESTLYLCYEYEINQSILEIISKEWLRKLKEEYVWSSFTIKNDSDSIFMTTLNCIIAKLQIKDVQIFNKFGLDFNPWNVRLNDTL